MTEDTEQFTVLENKAIGRNLALFRKLREKKASEVAEFIGIGEAAYTKYERGESRITIDIIQKVADLLKLDPLQILSTKPGSIVENITNSSIAIQENSTFQTSNDQQTALMLKLIENVVAMNEKLMVLLERKGE
jgi:transcriptional regulator with XRE-family HTH domain